MTPPASAAEAETHAPTREELSRYPWLSKTLQVRSPEVAIPPPPGFTRIAVEPGSFSAWLRCLPLRPAGTPVRDFQVGQILAGDDPLLAAVVELDVGTADLQQCADSIIRLHAEWLWSQGRKDRIAYRFTSGHLARWTGYAAGACTASPSLQENEPPASSRWAAPAGVPGDVHGLAAWAPVRPILRSVISALVFVLCIVRACGASSSSVSPSSCPSASQAPR